MQSRLDGIPTKHQLSQGDRRGGRDRCPAERTLGTAQLSGRWGRRGWRENPPACCYHTRIFHTDRSCGSVWTETWVEWAKDVRDVRDVFGPQGDPFGKTWNTIPPKSPCTVPIKGKSFGPESLRHFRRWKSVWIAKWQQESLGTAKVAFLLRCKSVKPCDFHIPWWMFGGYPKVVVEDSALEEFIHHDWLDTRIHNGRNQILRLANRSWKHMAAIPSKDKCDCHNLG